MVPYQPEPTIKLVRQHVHNFASYVSYSFQQPEHDAIAKALNAAYISLPGEQSFEHALTITHQTHQGFVQMLKAQDENIFVSGNYVYERMKRVIDHHLEHSSGLETITT